MSNALFWGAWLSTVNRPNALPCSAIHCFEQAQDLPNTQNFWSWKECTVMRYLCKHSTGILHRHYRQMWYGKVKYFFLLVFYRHARIYTPDVRCIFARCRATLRYAGAIIYELFRTTLQAVYTGIVIITTSELYNKLCNNYTNATEGTTRASTLRVVIKLQRFSARCSISQQNKWARKVREVPGGSPRT